MPLETASHISGLVASNPASSDGLNQADDHLRLIKSVLLTDVGNALVSKSLAVVDGSSGAPSVGYAADATAGFYRKSTGVQGIVGSLQGQGSVEIGSVIMHAAATAPTGYLVCDGTAVSRTTYASLFAVIGTTWGAGDGSTTFNVPNLLSRFPRHRQVGGNAGAVGSTQADIIKNHQHGVNGNTGGASADHTHTFSGTTGTMNSNTSHSHSSSAFFQVSGGSVGGGGAFGGAITASTSSVNIDHTHPFSGTTSGFSAQHSHAVAITSDFQGGGDPTETRPLSASLLFCIRAL